MHSLCQSGVRLEFFQNDNSRGVHVSVQAHNGVSQPSVTNVSGGEKEIPESPKMDHVGSILAWFQLSDTVDTTLHDDSWGSIPWTPKTLESSEVEETPWHFMRDAPGFRWQIRKLEPSDVADTPNQMYKFVIELARSSGSTDSVYDYTKPLFANLSHSELEAYNTEIARYLQRSWWPPSALTRKDQKSGGGMSSGLLVFPLPSPGRSTSHRPVVDARRENQSLPNASYSGATCSQILQSIRLNWRSGEQCRLLTLDGAQAFYRLHTSRLLTLKSNDRVFWCSRLVFGLNVGPCGLFICLSNYLPQKAFAALPLEDQRCLREHTLVYVYLDDLSILSWGDCSRAVSRFIEQIERVGGRKVILPSTWLCFGKLMMVSWC